MKQKYFRERRQNHLWEQLKGNSERQKVKEENKDQMIK